MGAALLNAATVTKPNAADDNVADYSIASVEYALSPLDRVGSLQAGLLCLPKGKLRWRDVARPDGETLARKLTEVIGGKLSVAARADPLFGDPEPPTRYRIRVVIEAVKLRLCIAGLGIGEKQPSGGGVATVRWETYDRVARQKIASDVFEMPVVIGKRDARGATGVLGDALLDSAARYATVRSQ